MPAVRRAGASGKPRPPFLATLSAALLLLTASPAAADLPNPGWSGSCPQRFVLVLDHSESMDPLKDEVHQAAEDLVDSLRGTTNQVAVITFGTEALVAVDLTDVSKDEQRDAVKDRIAEIEILRENEGGTNWEAALVAAEALTPNVVLLVTDGQPSVRGVPVDLASEPEDEQNVAAAVAASDRLKRAGARVVGVGLGLDQAAGGQANLVAVTGPALGDDYYTTGVHDLLPALYDVVSKACAIDVVDLPAPEGDGLPLLPLILGGAVTLALVVGAGVLLARRRVGSADAPKTALVPTRRTTIADPSISMDDIPPADPSTRLGRDDESHDSPPIREDWPAVADQPRRTARRINIPPPPTRGPQAGPERT